MLLAWYEDNYVKYPMLLAWYEDNYVISNVTCLTWR